VALLFLISALQLTASSAFSVGAGFAITSSTNGRASSSRLQMSEFMTHYEEIQVDTDHAMSVFDITPQIESIVAKSGCKEGTVTVLSKHSTVSVSINELEGRLVDDIRQFFLNLAPPHLPYLHNDLDYRVGPEDWPGGDEAWREFRRTQPVNTHSHLIAMMLGTSESIPISGGEMKKGKYQSILMVDIDGPKSRGIAVQITGGK
ncbi:MAG: thiamine phosphate synthase YjbQ (UPF0047 family), partial [Bacillariaceae sp.]|jgi:thiamine phosphate synthase YjbQ (UPF0047 family)